MQRAIGKVVCAVGVVAIGGCGSTSGFLRDSATLTQAEFKMDVSQIRYSRSVSGSAKVGEALCSIPLDEDQYKRAMEALYGSAQLKTNEVLTNFREDEVFSWFLGFYCQKTLTISADVIDVTPSGFVASPGSGSLPPAVPSAVPVSSSAPSSIPLIPAVK